MATVGEFKKIFLLKTWELPNHLVAILLREDDSSHIAWPHNYTKSCRGMSETTAAVQYHLLWPWQHQ